MILKKKYVPEEDDRRVVSKFAWLPVELGNIRVWLCWYRQVQKYKTLTSIEWDMAQAIEVQKQYWVKVFNTLQSKSELQYQIDEERR